MTERLVVVGQGYVGLPLAMAAARAGFEVVGYDVDNSRIKRLEAGDSFVEDIPAAVLLEALASGRYQPTADREKCSGFDVAVISVPTPLLDGNPDLSAVEHAARMLASHIRPNCTVVLESTTYPGTTEEVVCPILKTHSGLAPGKDFHVGYSPERIDPGNRTWTLETTPKLVAGIDESSLREVKRFYDHFVERTIPLSCTGVAELAKLLENTFRHVNVALVNELAMFAHDLGIDVWEAIGAAATKPFGYMRFTPGPGVGGHCLPIDPSYLSWRVERSVGASFRFVELANDINDHMPQYVVRRLVEALNRRERALRGSRVLVLGLAYKANTGDAREAPAIDVISELRKWGADVRVADPLIAPDSVADIIDLSAAELEAADAVVLLTDHDAFDYELVVRHAGYVLDTRHRMAGPQVEYL